MSVRRSELRVLVAVGVFAAAGLVWTGAGAAAGHDINVTGDAAKCDKTWGPPCFTPANGTVTSVNIGDTVTWHVLDGTHTVTPVDPAAFAGSGDLTGPDATFPVTFDKPGVFSFYCKHHGSVDKDGKTFHGMWGKIDVKGGDTTTTSGQPAPPPDGSSPPAPPPAKPDPGPAPPPPTNPPPTSQSGSSGPSRGPAPGGGKGETADETGRPWVGPPPPTAAPAPPSRSAAASAPAPTQPPTTRGKDGKDGKESRDGGEAGTPAVPPADELVRPPVPAFSTPTTAPTADAPTGAPQGDTVAVLKPEPGGHHKGLIIFGTVFGVGAFVVGVGGWKFTHRASKYWPA